MMISVQATPSPSLQPVPTTHLSNHGRGADLGPPYAVDEESFLDACRRLTSMEEAVIGGGGGSGGSGGGRGGAAGSGAVADAGLNELLMRSLGCLASFR